MTKKIRPVDLVFSLAFFFNVLAVWQQPDRLRLALLLITSFLWLALRSRRGKKKEPESP